MTKLLKYLLPLCFILSSGFSQLGGLAIEQSAGHSSAESTTLSIKTERALTIRASNHSHEQNGNHHHTVIQEEEETEISKVTFETNDAALVYTSSNNYFLSTQKCLYFSKYITYLPSYKSLYILFGVFRI